MSTAAHTPRPTPAPRHHSDFTSAQALVIDPNPISRSILFNQLRDSGFQAVAQCGRVRDARKTLEHRQFDVVLCEMEFPGEGHRAGQALLDELRREQLLPLHTVFIMVTGERSYDKVAEAAEAALDSYLIKPFTAQSLWERVVQARRRKNDLRDILDAVAEGRHAEAADLCSVRFQARSPYWLYAARLGAELYLRLGRHAEARQLLDAVIAAQAMPWARLGLARVQLDQQHITQALSTLQALVADDPGYADAHDVMGRAHMAHGQLDEALATYRRAAELTPGAVRRQQAHGMLAYFLGDTDAAVRALEKATVLGQGSKLFDPQCLVLLAQLRFRQRDAKALQRCLNDLTRLQHHDPASDRLQRFLTVVQALDWALQRQPDRAQQCLATLAGQLRDPDFDVEAGGNLLTLLTELAGANVRPAEAAQWVGGVGWRFGGTRAASELLARATDPVPAYAELLRRCHAQIVAAAEQALALSVSGNRTGAVQALLRHAEKTLNHKFTDSAHGILQRYPEAISQPQQLQAQLQALRTRMGHHAGALPAFARVSTAQGGIQIRGGGG